MNIWMLFCPSVQEAALMRWWVFSDGSWTLANSRVWALALTTIRLHPPAPPPAKCLRCNSVANSVTGAVGWKSPFPFWCHDALCFPDLGKVEKLPLLCPYLPAAEAVSHVAPTPWVWICHFLAYFIKLLVPQFSHVLKWVEKFYQPFRAAVGIQWVDISPSKC